jgi:hypothetical protein
MSQSPSPAAPPIEVVRRQLLALLREGVEGPKEAWSYFTDHGAGAGLLGTLEGWNAGEASRPGADGRASVAAHVHHTAFGMEASSAFIRGDRTPRDWKSSWALPSVDAAAWEAEKDRLRERYRELVRTLEEADLSTDEAFGGALAAVAHVAYHLGAIRQR